MEQYKIKILQETPFDKGGVELSIDEFYEKYSYLTKYYSYTDVIEKLKHDDSFFEWFELVEQRQRFKIGDWIWDEELKRALFVTKYRDDKSFWPNYISFEAVNDSSCKRLATNKEIKYHELQGFADGRLLIGHYKCYYFYDVWKEISNFIYNVGVYSNCSQKFADIASPDKSHWRCIPNGMRFGCITLSHNEIMEIAQYLNIKV